MLTNVDTRPGPLGEPEPVAFSLDGTVLQVREVLDRWPGNACTYFKVETEDSARYIMRHMHVSDEWDMHQLNVA